MALINCSECGKEISDKSSICIHCGCPLDDMKLKKVVIFDIPDNDPPRHRKRAIVWEYLHEIYPDETEYNNKVVFRWNGEPPQPIIIENLDISQANVINDKLHLLEVDSSIYNMDDRVDRHIEKTAVPKCPTCGSDKITNLTVVDRMISTALVGIASGKIGKHFECKICGYRW